MNVFWVVPCVSVLLWFSALVSFSTLEPFAPANKTHKPNEIFFVCSGCKQGLNVCVFHQRVLKVVLHLRVSVCE